MASLPTLALGTYANVSSTAIQGSDPVLEVIASADDTDYVYDATNSSHLGLANFALADMPADFGTMATLSIRLRYAWQAGTQVNSWNSVTARVFQSDGVTALTDLRVVGSAITTTTPTNSSVISFTGVNTTASKSVWDGALVQIGFSIAKSKGGDTLEKRVFAAELTGTYNVSSRVGDLSATLGAATISAAGTHPVTASLSKTLGGATISSGTSVSVAAALDKTLGAATLLGLIGEPEIIGDLSVTLGTLGTGADLTANLVSYWSLNEASGTRVDSHGSNDLSDNNTVGSTTGIINSGALFVATNNEFLSHVSNASLQMSGNTDFTIAAWVNLASLPTFPGYYIIASKDDSATNSRDYCLQYSNDGANGGFGFFGGQTGTIYGARDPAASSTGTWYFLTAWYDSGNGQLHLRINDSATHDSTSGITALDVSSSEFRIGARQYTGYENYFDGLIDEVGLWKRLLTADEITFLYNSGGGRSYADLSGGASGSVTVTADLTATLGAATVSSESSVAVAADSDVTLGAATLSGAASGAVVADLDQTLGAATLSADATVTAPGREADLSATLGVATLAATASAQIAADLDAALGAATLAGAVSVGDAAALSQTLGIATLTATATHLVTADLSATLGGLTLSAAGIAGSAADLDQSLGALTVSSDATTLVRADLAANLSALGFTSDGTVAAGAALSQTLGAVTVVSTGTIPATADLSATLGAATLSAAATVISGRVGNLDAILDAATISAAGTVANAAELSKTLGALTSVSAATHPVTAELASNLSALTITSGAATAIVANLSGTLGAVTVSADASSGMGANLSKTLGSATISSTGAVEVVSNSAATLGSVTVQSTSTHPVTASLSGTLGELTLTAQGGSPALTADLSATLGAATLVSTGTAQIRATLARQLGTLSVSSDATHPVTADLTKTLGSIVVSAFGGQAIVATLDFTLGGLRLRSQAGEAITFADLALNLSHPTTLTSRFGSGEATSLFNAPGGADSFKVGGEATDSFHAEQATGTFKR